MNSKKITWCKEFDIPNKNIPSIIYSNEFFDCFPVRQFHKKEKWYEKYVNCLLYTSPSPRDGLLSRMPSSA